MDIEADRAGVRVLVEVKGYPGATYLRGDRKGQRKSWHVGAQARTYFCNALLSGMVMRADDPYAHVVLAFPDVPTYGTSLVALRRRLKKRGSNSGSLGRTARWSTSPGRERFR